jgi:hypothetical protein
MVQDGALACLKPLDAAISKAGPAGSDGVPQWRNEDVRAEVSPGRSWLGQGRFDNQAGNFQLQFAIQAYPGQLGQGTWLGRAASHSWSLDRLRFVTCQPCSRQRSSIDVHNRNGRACMIASKYPGNSSTRSALCYLASHRC